LRGGEAVARLEAMPIKPVPCIALAKAGDYVRHWPTSGVAWFKSDGVTGGWSPNWP
jgi:hypothetical protein